MILAVDPGPLESAWLVYKTAPSSANPIGLYGKCQNAELLEGMRMGRFRDCGHLAIEMIASYGMAVGKEVFETCVFIGRVIEAWPGPSSRVFRKDIKLHICGSVRATDSNIRAALIDRFGPPGKKAAPGITYGLARDTWAALAIAVTYADKEREGGTP